MQFVKPQLFTEAIDKIGSKSPIGSKLNTEQWADVPLALRERALFSSTVENVRFLQRSRDALTDFLSANRDDSGALATGSRADFVKQLQSFAIAEGMGPLDAEDAGGLKDITSQQRLELIFDTQTRQAQDYGYWKQGQDPDVLDEFPASRFIRVLDVQDPRAWHQRFEGEVHLKSDLDFWIAINEDFGVPWGPWGWGCGHDVEDVDRDEAERLGLISPGEHATPAAVDLNDRLQASVNNLDDDLRAQLKEQFGDQIDISGDEVKWKGLPANSAKQANPETVIPDSGLVDIGEDSRANTAPVSDALAIDPSLAAAKKKAVENALRIIDGVHDDGTLPRITVEPTTRRDFVAAYASTREGAAVKIMIGNLRNYGEHVVTHELGHFIDHQALDAAGVNASLGSPVLNGWREAVMNSAAVKSLQAALTDAGTQYERGKLNYLLRPQELFARSYAQWITERSQDAKLLKQLPLVQAHFGYESQWTAEDFAPIARAFDELFQTKGWL